MTTPSKVSSEDVSRDVKKAVDAAGAYSLRKKEEYQKNLESRLAKLDADFAKWRDQGRNLKDDAKAKWEKRVADLENKRKTVQAKLTEVRSATAEAWVDIQKGAQSAWEDLSKAFQEAAKEF